MEQKKQNNMAVAPVKKLFWRMGLPMIVSMVLQALYNVVDSVFVANMEGAGALALAWWTFPLSEVLTCFVCALFLKSACKTKLETV